jgi:hypothetical protein
MARKPRPRKTAMETSVPRSLGASPAALPLVTTSPVFTQTMRFSASSATGNLGVSRGDLLNMLVLGVSTSTGYSILECIKLNYMDIYLPPASATNSTNMVLTWLSTLGQNKVVALTTLGTALPAYVRVRPPKDSFAGLWSSNQTTTGGYNTENLFSFATATGMVVDVNVSFCLQNQYGAAYTPLVQTSTRAISAGVLYTAALDGTSSNVLTPIGRLQF